MQVYLNGQYLPAETAAVSVMDRGFIFGDGVYEVIPVFSGSAFRWDEHLRRLKQSMSAVRIDNPYPDDEWEELTTRLIDLNGGGDQALYLQVTRGAAARDHVPHGEMTATVFAYSSLIDEDYVPSPVSAITAEDVRWKRCSIKSISLLPNVLLRQEAKDHGAYEAILLRDGLVTEGAASNVFLVLDGVVVTPPLGPFLLAGVTRELVLELLRNHGASIQERPVAEKELPEAEEIWLTSSTREILPVTRLDGTDVGSGRPGPAWERAYDYYRTFKRAFIRD
jgi:D-alanine transaminase